MSGSILRDGYKLDALNPAILSNLVKTEIEKLIDQDAWDSALEREHHERQMLEKISKDLTQAEN